MQGDSADSGSHASRIQSLDVARGCAVIGMIFMHLVATEGGRTGWENACASVAAFLEGKAAALFCILAGMAWGLQAQRSAKSPHYARYILRRSLSLGFVGILLHLRIWQTEILLPLALMMPICLLTFRSGTKTILGTICLLLIAHFVALTQFGHFAISDWNENGLHLADSSFGWQTVRFLVFDGNYPLLPWLIFPLLGMLLVLQSPSSQSARNLFVISLLTTIMAHLYRNVSLAKGNAQGGYWAVTWIPTTLPFLILTGSVAVCVIYGLLWWESARGLPRTIMSLALLGRASLTHYLLHIGVVFVPLRLAYPNEQWSIEVGVKAMLLYFAFAYPLSALWFRHYSRGPLEGLWAWVSGASR